MTLSRTHAPHTIRYKGATYEKVARPFVAPTSTAVLPQRGEELPPTQQQELLLYSVQEWNRWYATVSASANLRDANLEDANLRGAYLEGADLSDAYLEGADLSHANLQDANLQGAALSHANLRSADLGGALLQGAYLSLADLRSANLSRANLSHANLQNAMYNGRTQFPANFDPTAAGMKKVR